MAIESSALSTSSANDKFTTEDHAFLTFTLGPVQTFIASARTLRDLWTGSYLLSWLTYKAMEPILELEQQDGQSRMVFPALSDNPLWKFYHQGSDDALRIIPCIPSQFLAESMSIDEAKELEVLCMDRFDSAWNRICNGVRKGLDELVQQYRPDNLVLGEHGDDWLRLWSDQLRSFFEVHIDCLPWMQCDLSHCSELLGLQNGSDTLNMLDGERWQLRWRMHQRQIDNSWRIRHVPAYRPGNEARVANKCTLLGRYEQMGPAVVSESKQFWEAFAAHIHRRGTWTRKRDGFCALSLVKRFAWPLFFMDELRLAASVRSDDDPLRFSDTATVAAKIWLKAHTCDHAESPALSPSSVRTHVRNVYPKAKVRWSGHWLHWHQPQPRREDEDEGDIPTDKSFQDDKQSVWDIIWRKRDLQGPAPTYYAVLMIDGDNMGDTLRQLERRGQLRFSQFLADFSMRRVGDIVENYDGELIYTGGDDILALLPTETALSCALQLSNAFRDDWPIELTQDAQAPPSVSAGLAVVHFKEDLRFALASARRAEHHSKQMGKAAATLSLFRRSGEATSALLPWDYVETVESWVEAFRSHQGLKGASDRWTYQLAAELPTLEGLSAGAMRAEIRRLVNRSDSGTRQRLAPGQEQASAKITKQFEDYAQLLASDRYRQNEGMALRGFVTLCQSASFLARGRDS